MSSFIPVVQGNLLAGLLAVLALCGTVLSGCLPVKRAEAMMIDADMKHIAVAAPTSIAVPTPTATPTPEPTHTPTPAASSSESAVSPPAPYPLPSLEQRIEKSHIVARVRLSSTATRVESIETDYKQVKDGRFFGLFMDFEFEVLEYLKGSGNSRIWGSVSAGGGFDTRKDALAAAVDYWKIRDKYIYSRWDDREAIVMLYDVSSSSADMHIALSHQSDTYLLGRMVVGNGFWESYSVASPMHKSWLPSALPSGGASGVSGGERQFLLDAPGGYAVGGRGPSKGASGPSEAYAPKISLSSFKAKIAEVIGTPTPTSTATPEPTATPDPAPTATPVSTLTTPATATAKPLTEDTPTPLASSSESAVSPPAPPSLLSLEQIIEKSHIVARVRLSSTATRVESIETDYKQVKDGRFFGLFMDFEFEVLEYLKGSGNSRIWGSVSAGGGFDTRKDALAAAVDYWKVRDKYIYSRWDDREAIVMLYDVSSSSADMHVALSRQSDTHRLGAMRIVGNEFVEGYSVASPYFKAWLPSALPGSGASGASGGERQFLLDAPGGYAVGGRGPSKGASGPSEAYAPKISLSSFKAKIAEVIGTPTPTSIPTATPSPTHTPTTAPTATPEPTATPDPRQRQLQCQR